MSIKKLIIGMAEVYGTELSVPRLDLYVELLSDIPKSEVEIAIRDILRDPGQKFFPLPAVIRERAAPQMNPEHEAIEAASRITQAIAKFGWNNQELAEKFIGPLGWRIVERDGGWSHICESVMADEIPIRRAQWREIGKALQARARLGMSDTPPQLPPVGTVFKSGKLSEQLSIGNIMREKE